VKKDLKIGVNNVQYGLSVETHRTLLEVIRDDLGLTGTKNGCGMGDCGACTVILNGEAANACLVLAHEVDGQEVNTIEGLSRGGDLHHIQRAFVDHGAIQCGFCTPGMIMATKALLDKNPSANETEIRNKLVGNLCRCTGYIKVMNAVKAAQELMRKD